jgi:hypothetical protein
MWYFLELIHIDNHLAIYYTVLCWCKLTSVHGQPFRRHICFGDDVPNERTFQTRRNRISTEELRILVRSFGGYWVCCDVNIRDIFGTVSQNTSVNSFFVFGVDFRQLERKSTTGGYKYYDHIGSYWSSTSPWLCLSRSSSWLSLPSVLRLQLTRW